MKQLLLVMTLLTSRLCVAEESMDVWPDLAPGETTRLIGEKQPQVQFTKVEQIAGLALFLASDTASNMQGTALVSDGGWTAQ